MSVSAPKRKKTGVQRPKKRPRIKEDSQTLREDQLLWKEVELPDRLEDAEGFFRLEEIDDVEVIKGEGKSGLEFRAKTKRPESTTSAPSTSSYTNGHTLSSEDHEEEWAGFDEDATPAQERTAPERRKKSILKIKPPTENLGIGNESAYSNPWDLLLEVLEERVTDSTAWEELQIVPEIVSAIANLSFTKPTSIQKACIPDILAGHDVIGKASTGSGKTLAFGIPILQACLNNSSLPTALILSPTRELAHQLTKHLSALFEGVATPPRIATVTGGLSIQKQQRQLLNADVIIATPGRLWEVINDSHGLISQLKQLRMLIVDEADRLLSEGHFQEVGQILEALDKEVVQDDENHVVAAEKPQRQVLVFSATFHKGLLQKLAGQARAGDMLNNQQSMEYLIKKLPFRSKPKFIDVNPTTQMVGGLKEGVIECGAMEKDLYLYSVLIQKPSKRTLVFTNSISAVRRVASLLQNLATPSLALHSTMPQKSRLRSVERFSTTSNAILVATDVAARGLDIKGIDMIIHYHVPRTADMYVHRSGRTARAEASGKSLLLCSPDELAGVTRLIAKVHSDTGTTKSLIPVEIDRQLVKRLGPRIKLAQRITDATLANEKTGSRDDWIHKAAEDLGIDYDSDEFAAQIAKSTRGRGGRDKNKSVLSKAEIGSLRAQLKELLSKRVNLGVSEKYLAGGTVDVDELLREKEDGKFLGNVDAIVF